MSSTLDSVVLCRVAKSLHKRGQWLHASTSLARSQCMILCEEMHLALSRYCFTCSWREHRASHTNNIPRIAELEQQSECTCSALQIVSVLSFAHIYCVRYVSARLGFISSACLVSVSVINCPNIVPCKWQIRSLDGPKVCLQTRPC
jgi:hypothetical protein